MRKSTHWSTSRFNRLWATTWRRSCVTHSWRTYPEELFIRRAGLASEQALAGAIQSIRRYHPRMAVAAEHLPDDTTAIPALVSRIAAYTVKSSSCKDNFLRIDPEVLLFQPR